MLQEGIKPPNLQGLVLLSTIRVPKLTFSNDIKHLLPSRLAQHRHLSQHLTFAEAPHWSSNHSALSSQFLINIILILHIITGALLPNTVSESIFHVCQKGIISLYPTHIATKRTYIEVSKYVNALIIKL